MSSAADDGEQCTADMTTRLNSPARRGQLHEHLSDSAPTLRKQRRPSVLSIVAKLFVLGIPVFVLFIFAQTRHDMELRHRIHYAINEVFLLKAHVQEYYLDVRHWPTGDGELGVATRGDYPDGGYYELEDNGVIRIRFTVKPDLMKGSIVLSPTVEDDGITWKCHADGYISLGHLPAACR